MQIFLVTIVTFVITFLLNPISKKASKKADLDRFLKVHVHHSFWGALIAIVGIIIRNDIVTGLGLGMYLGHVAEEIYFNKKNFIRAFFIFITR